MKYDPNTGTKSAPNTPEPEKRILYAGMYQIIDGIIVEILTGYEKMKKHHKPGEIDIPAQGGEGSYIMFG